MKRAAQFVGDVLFTVLLGAVLLLFVALEALEDKQPD